MLRGKSKCIHVGPCSKKGFASISSEHSPTCIAPAQRCVTDVLYGRMDGWMDGGEGACVLDNGSPVVYIKLITLMRKVWGMDLSHTTQAKRACFPLVHCIWKQPPSNLL